VPLPASRNPAPKPSRLTALVSAAVVAAFDRRWLGAPLASLREEGDPAAETLSRLKRRLLPSIEALVEGAHQRGRPPADSTAEETAALRARVAALEEQLALAASVIRTSGVRDRTLQDRLVAAAHGLRQKHGVDRSAFCASLGIPERTFRYWAARAPAPPAPPSPPPAAPRPRPKNEGRFALELCPPDLQSLADTTAICAFGVDLHLVATQDPGRRHKELLSAFAACEKESSDVVVDVLAQALAELPGAQLLVDQGTPYMAEATRAACERLEVEHAPQKEGAPTEKAPIERAFGTVKNALRPLLDLTCRLAQACPALRRPDLARAATTLLLGVFLRVYTQGRRHLGYPLAAADAEARDDLSDAARQRARAEDRSRKLFLASLHDEYHLEEHVSRDAFVRAHRRHALEDMKAAERALRQRACRCQVRRCDLYFTAILRRIADEATVRRAREAAARAEERARKREEERFAALQAHLDAHPAQRLFQALDGLLDQWDAAAGDFAFGGRGWPRGQLRRALEDFQRLLPLVWTYEVDATFDAWVASTAAPDGPRSAISAVLREQRDRLAAPSRPSSSSLSATPSPATFRPWPEGQRPKTRAHPLRPA